MLIKQIVVFYVLQPLKDPYLLPYGTVSCLESVLVRVAVNDGAIGWGESTPLQGYSESSFNDVWKFTNSLAPTLIGHEIEDVLSLPIRDTDGFLYTALWTALEEAAGRIPNKSACVPLVTLAQEKAGESPRSTLERVRKQGAKVYKIKIGMNGGLIDQKRVLEYQDALQVGETVRIDANQSLTFSRAEDIIEICRPDCIELFEQPLPVCEWEASAELASRSNIPIMLDESITDAASLVKTHELKAASIVKLKWMKQGGKHYLDEMVRLARSFNMRIVFGNGVAGGLNNRNEALYWADDLADMKLAGEMNGFMKLESQHPYISESNGTLLLDERREDWMPVNSLIKERHEYN